MKKVDHQSMDQLWCRIQKITNEVINMPGGNKQKVLREGPTPSKHPHKVIVTPKQYDRILVGAIKNILKK